MADDPSQRVEELFDEGLDVPPGDRLAWLEQACDGDQVLFDEVASLFAADDAADSTARAWEAPATELLAEAMSETGDPWIGQPLGPFVIERLLGQGGMGKVYLARRATDEFVQRAAVKLVRTGPGRDEVLARFAYERATLARLEHPGIARLLDGGATEAGTPWLAMEYVEGRTLDAWSRARTMDVDERLALALHVCDAVSYAHANLVIHRDLKPSNVMVDDEGRPHLLDFGVARMLDADDSMRLTVGGAAPMTPAYASPEQVRGEAVGVASDVYALGVLIYELLVGRLPYRLEQETSVAVEWAVCHQDPQRPSVATASVAPTGTRRSTGSRHARRLAGDLDNILLKALEKDPARRYESVAALADGLRRHREGLPVGARNQTVFYRAAKLVRRHRAASAVALVLVLVLAGAALQWLDSVRRDQEQLDQIFRLSDARRLEELIDELATDLRVPLPDRGAALDAWILRARELIARCPDHRARLAALDETISTGQASEDQLWWRDQLDVLVERVDAFGRDDPFGATLAGGLHRRRLVKDIERRSRIEAAEDWAAAIAEISELGVYRGLELAPLWGLAPLRRDPRSGLWEFWLVASGNRPHHDGDGPLELDEESAAVLVLIPGGEVVVGAQPDDAGVMHLDPLAQPAEQPPLGYDLDPYLLGKHEVTRGQWLRMTGEEGVDQATASVVSMSKDHPAIHVSWFEAESQLRRFGLILPTEIQWEGACRAGLVTPWITGSTPLGLDRFANLADLSAERTDGSAGWNYAPAHEFGLDDGQTLDAPIATFLPNGLGLHDMHGNVWEWCRDMPAPYGLTEVEPGDGLRIIPESVGELGIRVLRGGAFGNPPERLRSSVRWSAEQDFRSYSIGIRMSRALEPEPEAGR